MQTTTETEITEAEIKAMKKREREKSLSAIRENGSLRGRRSPGRKSSGIMVRWFFLQGEEQPPTRVLMMNVRKPAKPKDDEVRKNAAFAKRHRKNAIRRENAQRMGLL